MRLIREYVIPRLGVDIVVFYVILMVVGMVAARVGLSVNVLWAFIANYLILVFAFIINDIEDQEEDAKAHYVPQTWQDNVRLALGFPLKGVYPEGSKRFLNPFGHKLVSPEIGYIYCGIIVLASLIFSYLAGGWATLLCGLTILIVGFLYSIRLVRLKSQPVLDILSHAYLLAGAQVLFFLTLPGAIKDWVSWLLFAILFLASVAGDLRNEVRDFEEDQSAGIRNTSTIIGNSNAVLVSNIMHWFSVVSGVLVVGYIILTASGILAA